VPLSDEDEQRIREGVGQFHAAWEEVRKGPSFVAARPDPATIAALTEDRFADEGEALAFSTENESLQRAGKSLWQCVMAALRRRVCGKAAAEKKVNEAIRKARLTDPGMLSVGAASIVAVAIGSLFTGPIAVAAAPVLGGLAYLLIASGVDGFCDWEDEPPEGGESQQAGRQAKTKPQTKSQPKTKARAGNRGKQ
jgi:hypothetical protein